MSAGAIGQKVLNPATGRIAHVVTYYEDGDLMVRCDGELEKWSPKDCVGLGR